MSRRTRLTVDDGLRVWQARDAYRVQTALYALFYLPQFALIVMAFLAHRRGLWASAAVCFLAILALWGVRWLVCAGLSHLGRWGWTQLRGLCGMRALLVLLGLLGSLSGCAEMAHQYQRNVWGIDCRQDKLVNRQCVPVRRSEVPR